jgi:hypothetical protein
MFRVAGRLSEKAQHAVGDFGALEVTTAPPETIICCAVVDEAHLHGLLSLFRALGLGIVSMHQVPEPCGEAGSSPSATHPSRAMTEPGERRTVRRDGVGINHHGRGVR